MTTPEKLLMRFHDGPLVGDRVMEREWPLPDEIPAPNGQGRYVKERESQLKAPQPGVLRGAEYRWDGDWRQYDIGATTS